MFRPGSATCLQIPQTLGEGGGAIQLTPPTPIIGGHVGAPPGIAAHAAACSPQ